MNTETEKNYLGVKEFLDSIGKAFKQLDLKHQTGVISSQQFNRARIDLRYDVMNAIDDINLTTDEKIKILLLLTSIR
jgi:hypothetical protein